MRTIWWLIQVNAVAAVFLFYQVWTSTADIGTRAASFVILFLAALLEYFGYYRIHKPTR